MNNLHIKQIIRYYIVKTGSINIKENYMKYKNKKTMYNI